MIRNRGGYSGRSLSGNRGGYNSGGLSINSGDCRSRSVMVDEKGSISLFLVLGCRLALRFGMSLRRGLGF